MTLINTSVKEKAGKHFMFLSFLNSFIAIALFGALSNAQSVLPSLQIAVSGKDTVRNIPPYLSDLNDPGIISIPGTEPGSENYSSGNEICDSIYETKNFGYVLENYKWYFYYNNNFKVDSSKRYYFNVNGEYENIMENRTYNDAGQLIRLVRKQPVYSVLQYNSTDSTLIDVHMEEYTYDNGNVVRNETTDLMFVNILQDGKIESQYNTNYEFLNYDNNNRLQTSSSIPGDTSFYYYDGNNNLKYLVFTLNGTFYSVTKYNYTGTDSTRIITKYLVKYDNPQIQLQLDTISYWDVIEQFTENYDTAGREKSLIHRETFSIYPVSVENDYKVEYSYSASNKLLHTSYYTWEISNGTPAWFETLRIDNTYDNKDNLKNYRKTFWDDRTGNWEIDDSKTYYYSAVPGILNTGNTKYNELSFYPNPSANSVEVKGLVGNEKMYFVYSLSGIVVLSGRFENNRIDISGLGRGMYIMKIQSGNVVYSGRFIKK